MPSSLLTQRAAERWRWIEMADSREMRGEAIAKMEGAVRRVSFDEYRVRSQSGDGEYHIVLSQLGWICDCLDSKFRGQKCKHAFAVEFSLNLRQKVRESVVLQPVSVHECYFCRSLKLKRFGVRKTKAGGIQRFLCGDCGRTFSLNLGFEGMRATPQAITQAMQLYFTGESLRSVQKFLRLQGVNISHQSVWNWIQKYVALMGKYLDQITPKVSETWRADELFVKIRGDMKFLFAMMDDETRFWIAQQIADTKFTADVRPLFVEGKRFTGRRPLTLITDGGQHFIKPFRKEFYTHAKPFSRHVRDIRLNGEVHNNKMERLNGEVRDREKVMRGLKTVDTPILKGYQLFHNYIRPHEALNGETPADRCGIRVEGENKWLTIIQNASKTEAKKVAD
jgi:transposase-like protein